MMSACALINLLDTGAASTASAQLVDGSGAVIDPGRSAFFGTASSYSGITLCGDYNVQSIAATTFKIKLATNGGTLSITNAQASGSAAIQWMIFQKDTGLPAPLLVGSVTSNTSGIERIESGVITSPTTITSQSGSWISSVTNGSTGNYSVNFTAGMFSAAPRCLSSGSAALYHCGIAGAATTSAVNVACRDITTAGAPLVNSNFNIHCMGPR
jgi:hypothetical protein